MRGKPIMKGLKVLFLCLFRQKLMADQLLLLYMNSWVNNFYCFI
jgi:hypothetical protein